MTQVMFECRSVGFPCEWALRAPTSDEVVRRMSEHVRCAHGLPELSPPLQAQVRAAVHPA